jgi:hypothetical protein
MFSRKFDMLDGASAAFMALAGFFALAFFWQVFAGTAGDEEDFKARLRVEAEKRIRKERTQIGFLLEKEVQGRGEDAWTEGLTAEPRLQGNSQFHLFLARGYRERNRLDSAIREYRRAVEANRDYTDRHSAFFLGEKLRSLIREGRKAYLADGPSDAVRDLFFLERSLARGCH